MKNSKYILHSVAVLAVAALATACSSEDELTDKTSGNKETVTITAYQPSTRVGFDSNGDGYWQEGDKIGVWSWLNGESKSSPFTIESGYGTASATFSGTVTGEGTQYAVYPYNDQHYHDFTEDKLYYYLPSSYTYTKVGQDYSQKDGNSFCMPMLGIIRDNEVTFGHMGGVICMKIDKMPAESGTVTVKEASNKLCGSFKIVYKSVREISTSESNSCNTVTFTYSGATVGKPGVFYLPVATGTYTLTVTVAGGEVTNEVTTKALSMERGHLKKVNITLGSKGNSKKINGHMFIDLGLPSGLLWAETNIGAETAYDDGNYYAWGETKSKENYSWDTYSWGTSDSDISKYNDTDKLTTLELEDDAAYVNWGSGCRMPTQSEMSELNDESNCTWTWVSCTNSAGETIGCYKVVSVKNGNIIYLPASSWRGGDGLTYYRTYGDYWSSTLNDSSVRGAYQLYFRSGYRDIISGSRYYGSPVRPVAEP